MGDWLTCSNTSRRVTTSKFCDLKGIFSPSPNLMRFKPLLLQNIIASLDLSIPQALPILSRTSTFLPDPQPRSSILGFIDGLNLLINSITNFRLEMCHQCFSSSSYRS